LEVAGSVEIERKVHTVNPKLKEVNLKVSIIGTKGYPYVYGAYETMVKQLGHRFLSRGLEVTIYCHRPLFDEKPKEVNGIKLVYTPAIETKSLAQLSNSFFSFLHACFSDADVIFIVNTGNGPFGILTKLFKKPTVINVDGIEWLRPKWKGFGAKYFYWASKLSTKFFDHLVTDADEMQKVYKELFNVDSTVIAYGSNPEVASDPALIKNWGLDKYQYYLIVGRLIPDNNWDIIINGFIKTNSQRKLVVVGDVPYKDKYASNLKSIQDDRLIFTGYIKDVAYLRSLFHNAYAYCHGHEYGGTNPVMLEAMGYGSSILALNTRFNQEMLQNGKYGWYFEKNPDSVKEIIERAENCPEEIFKLKEISRKGLTKKYDWEHVTDQYVAVFKSLAKKKVHYRKNKNI